MLTGRLVACFPLPVSAPLTERETVLPLVVVFDALAMEGPPCVRCWRDEVCARVAPPRHALGNLNRGGWGRTGKSSGEVGLSRGGLCAACGGFPGVYSR